MKNIFVFIICCSLFLACKKEVPLSSKNLSSNKIKTDTVRIENKNLVVFITPTSAYIDSLKNSYKNEDDFFTIADDANFYTAEAGDYIINQRVDTINITNQKILKIGGKVINVSKYKPWTLLLYKKDQSQIKNIFPIDIEKEFFNYYLKNQENNNGSLEDFLITNKLNPSNILYKNEFDFNADGLLDYILILKKDDNVKTFILIEKANNNFSLSFASDVAIPCEACGNGAEAFYDYKVEKGNLLFSSSYKSNEDIYKIDFKFKNFADNSFVLDKVTVNSSKVGESTEKEVILDKTTFGVIRLRDFNYSDFIGKYIIK